MTKKKAVSTFRECALFVFERIGLPRPGESYLADLESVYRAASEWHAERGLLMGPCLFNMPELCRKHLFTGNLDRADQAGFLGNEAARDFVRFVDERSNYRGTLLMLQVLITIQLAIRPQQNAPGGSA